MDRKELLRRYAVEERDFTGVNLRHVNLSGDDLRGINLSWADLTGADLTGTDLGGAVLIETNLGGADLTSTILKDALFCKTIMPYGSIKSDPIRVITIQQFLNRYAAGERRFPGLVIPRADLSNKDLRGISLSHHEVRDILKYPPYLPYANLSGANLEGINLMAVNLKGANLSNANLSKTILRDANLTDVNLRGANLLGADIEGVNFTRADLTDARIDGHSLYWLTFFHNTTLPNGEVIVEPTRYVD